MPFMDDRLTSKHNKCENYGIIKKKNNEQTLYHATTIAISFELLTEEKILICLDIAASSYIAKSK